MTIPELRIFARSLALMAMLLAQLAIAHHFSVHCIEHDGAVSHAQGDHDSCDLCVAGKGIAHAVWNGYTLFQVQPAPESSYSVVLYAEPSAVQSSPYDSRGPPSLS